MRGLLRRVLCSWLGGGHDLGRVPVWRNGKARLRCQYGCGYETAGIDVPQERAPIVPVVRRQVAWRVSRIVKGRWQ